MRLLNGIKSSRVLLVILAVACGFSWQAACAQMQAIQQEISAARESYIAHDYTAAQDHYTKALTLGAKLPAGSKISLYTNLGAVLREAHKFEAADAAFNKAITLAQSSKQDHTVNYAGTLKQYAALLRKMRNTDKADEMERLADKVLNPDVPGTNEQLGMASATTPAVPTAQAFDPASISAAPSGSGGTGQVPVQVASVATANGAARAGEKLNGRLQVIEFYTDWCGYCKKFAPIWDQVASQLSSQADFKQLNGDDAANRELMDKWDVKGFPRLIFTDNSGKAYVNHRGAPGSVDAFSRMITDFLAQHN